MINFLISFDLPLINCERELNFSWSKDYILCIKSEILRKAVVAAKPPYRDRAETETTSATFQITSVKLYTPAVTKARI